MTKLDVSNCLCFDSLFSAFAPIFIVYWTVEQFTDNFCRYLVSLSLDAFYTEAERKEKRVRVMREIGPKIEIGLDRIAECE